MPGQRPSPRVLLRHRLPPPPPPPPLTPVWQSSTPVCPFGSKMSMSLWRRWAAEFSQRRSLTGSAKILVAFIASPHTRSHSRVGCSYKRHTQRSTHFSALLDACSPPLPTFPRVMCALYRSDDPSAACAPPLPLLLTAPAGIATAAALTQSGIATSTSSSCAAAVGSSAPRKMKYSAWPKT